MHKIITRAAAGLLVAALLTGAALADTPPGGTASYAGIDVYHGNGAIDWAAVAQSKSWVYIKASEGENYTDPMFAANRTGAAAAGMKWGPYHFLRFNVSPEAQAEHFWEETKGTGYTLKPVVDVETADGVQKAVDVRALLKRFCDRFKALSGEDPVIYSYTSYINEYGLASEFSGYTLWQADYRGYLGSTGWDASVWQYSDSGSVSGVTAPSVDLDRLYDTSVYEGNTSSATSSTAQSTYTADWYPVGTLSGRSVSAYAKTAIAVRDSAGNALGGHFVSAGDPFIILSASGGSAEVLYPVPSLGAWFHGYIRNKSAEYSSVGWHAWRNGSTDEAVYNAAWERIGTIYPYEYATWLDTVGSRTLVLYTTSAGVETKTGYVWYKGR